MNFIPLLAGSSLCNFEWENPSINEHAEFKSNVHETQTEWDEDIFEAHLTDGTNQKVLIFKSIDVLNFYNSCWNEDSGVWTARKFPSKMWKDLIKEVTDFCESEVSMQGYRLVSFTPDCGLEKIVAEDGNIEYCVSH